MFSALCVNFLLRSLLGCCLIGQATLLRLMLGWPSPVFYWKGHSLFEWNLLNGLHVRRVTTCPNACSQGQETCWVQELGTPNSHHSLKHGQERWQNHLGYALTLEMWCIEENKYKVLKLTTNSWFWVLQTVSRQLHLSKCSNSTFQHKA